VLDEVVTLVRADGGTELLTSHQPDEVDDGETVLRLTL
jgi:hypothetical protein